MNNYSLIATDLDGTLLDSNGNVSKENLSAIEEIASRGINVVLSTGRTLSEIPQALKNNPYITYLIGSNGAGVWDLKNGKKIISLGLANSVSGKVFDILQDYKANITFRHGGESFVDKNDWDEKTEEYYNICRPHRLAVETFANYKEKFMKFASSLEDIETFAVFFHSKEEMEQAFERFKKEKDLLVVKAWDYNLEIFSCKSGKGNALKKLSDSLKLPIDKTIAIGDSNNDISMLERAGLSLCVDNASNLLKSISDKVICSNDEHIMEYILNNILHENI